MVGRIAVVKGKDDPTEFEVTFPGWEGQPPYPFVLSGRSTATVVMHLAEPAPWSARVLVHFDGAHDRWPGIEYQANGLDATTVLPPGSLAIVKPPPD